MIWSEVIKLSCYSTMSVVRSNDNLLEYAAVSFINDFETVLFPNVLYFSSYTQWLKFKDVSGLSFVLLAEAAEASNDFFPTGNINLISFNNQQDFLEFYTVLQTELSFERKMESEMQKIFLMVSDNVGLQKIVDRIAKIYHRPVTIIDNAFSFIACSQNYILTDSMNSEAVKRGHLPDDAMDYLRKISILNPKRKTTETILINPRFSKFNDKYLTNYFTYIYLNNINICSFSVLEIGDNPIPERELRYLPRIATMLSVELQKKSFYMLNKANYYTHLFSTLLGDQALGKDNINKRLQQFGYKLKRYKYIICVDIKYMSIAGTEIQLLADRLLYYFENSFYMITDDSILYFVSRDEGELISQKEVSGWDKILEFEAGNVKIGISSAYENLNYTKQYYQDAKEAIILGNRYDPNKKLYLYDEYRIIDMVENISPHTNLSSLCYPSLIRLVTYDESKGTNLTYTLFKYLENPKNPAQVCEELFIHKNTLYYRLNKISSIMGTNFESANEIAQIELTFAILKCQGRFDIFINNQNGRPCV